jgi:(p)ppGpp synthase/HD superfamily hydrolase
MNKQVTTANYVSFATEAHGEQMYGDKPYIYHLSAVENVLADFGYTDYKWKACAWLHDVVEDTNIDLADIIRAFGAEIADIVISCTGYGENRKQRVANILDKLQFNSDACIVKCADRIANVEASGKKDMYREEQDAFKKIIERSVPKEMLDRLEKALK